MRTIILLAFVVVLAAGCGASKSEFDALQSRVYGLDSRQNSTQQRVDQLTSQLARAQQQLAGYEQAKGSAAALWADVDGVKAKLAGIEGQIDNLNRQVNPDTAGQLSRLEAEVRAMKAALASQLGVTVAAPGEAPGEAAQGTLPGQPAQPGQPATVAPGQPAAPTAAPTAAPAQPAAPADPAKALFDKGYEAYEKGDYKSAQSIFAEFASAYPKHGLVASAKFWEGESFFQLKDYPNAILRYEEVIKKGKANPRYNSAMLKEGIAFMNMGKTEAGKARLKQLAEEAPASPEGKRAKAILQGAKP